MIVLGSGISCRGVYGADNQSEGDLICVLLFDLVRIVLMGENL